ncbi:hypothetical protein AAMO2058_001337500 [Amorphochlora amoebiformis]
MSAHVLWFLAFILFADGGKPFRPGFRKPLCAKFYYFGQTKRGGPLRKGLILAGRGRRIRVKGGEDMYGMSEEEERRLMAGIPVNPLDDVFEEERASKDEKEKARREATREKAWWESISSINVIEVIDDRSGRGLFTFYHPMSNSRVVVGLEDWDECVRVRWMMTQDDRWARMRPIPRQISPEEFREYLIKFEAVGSVARMGQLDLVASRPCEDVMSDLSQIAAMDLYRTGSVKPVVEDDPDVGLKFQE